MITDLADELKQIEKDEARLAKRKQTIAAKLQKAQAQEKKLEDLVKKSGFDSPRALIKSLMVKYGVKVSGSAAKGKPRTRTRVTAELRDKIKKDVEKAGSKNQVAKATGISYAVVSKIVNGDYDKL